MEAQATLKKDLEAAKKLQEEEEAQAKKKAEAKKEIQEKKETLVPAQVKEEKPSLVEPYNIRKNVEECLAKATIGQLLKDNLIYRRQLRDMLIRRRRRRLPKVGECVKINMICEDLGACEISLQISGCVISYVLIDGGSGVNIMTEATAHKLGFKKFEATSKSMRPSTYPILIGRPWLYGAKVKSDWGRKEFTFGSPPVKVPLGTSGVPRRDASHRGRL
ncbi:unnamed protein product [Calypogeia fissa]